MGGELSVQFTEGSRPIIKVGEDEVIFNMYQMYHSSWEINKVKEIVEMMEDAGTMRVIV